MIVAQQAIVPAHELHHQRQRRENAHTSHVLTVSADACGLCAVGRTPVVMGSSGPNLSGLLLWVGFVSKGPSTQVATEARLLPPVRAPPFLG